MSRDRRTRTRGNLDHRARPRTSAISPCRELGLGSDSSMNAPTTGETEEIPMKFMLIMQGTSTGWESMSTWSPADFQAHVGFMKSLNRELKASGELVTAEGLDVPKRATIVRA